MFQLDSELNALRIRLATLEEQKRIESEIVSAWLSSVNGKGATLKNWVSM